MAEGGYEEIPMEERGHDNDGFDKDENYEFPEEGRHKLYEDKFTDKEIYDKIFEDKDGTIVSKKNYKDSFIVKYNKRVYDFGQKARVASAKLFYKRYPNMDMRAARDAGEVMFGFKKDGTPVVKVFEFDEEERNHPYAIDSGDFPDEVKDVLEPGGEKEGTETSSLLQSPSKTLGENVWVEVGGEVEVDIGEDATREVGDFLKGIYKKINFSKITLGKNKLGQYVVRILGKRGKFYFIDENGDVKDRQRSKVPNTIKDALGKKLSEETNEKEVEINKLNEEIKEKEEVIDQLRKKAEEQIRKEEKDGNKIKELEGKLGEGESKIKELEGELKKRKEEISSLKKDEERQKKENEGSFRQLENDYKEKLKESKQAIEANEREKTKKLKEDNDKRNRETNEKHERKMREKGEQISNLEKRLDLNAREKKELIAAAKEDLKRLENQRVEDLRKVKEDNEAEVEKLKKDNEALGKERDKFYDDKISDLKTNYDDRIRETTTGYEERIKEKGKQISNLTNELRKTKITMGSLREEIAEIKNKTLTVDEQRILEESEMTIEENEEKIDELTRENEAMQEKCL